MTDDDRSVLGLTADRQPIGLPPLLEDAARRLERYGFLIWTVGGWFATIDGWAVLQSENSKMQTILDS
jgi:hypothetical protein